jgi:branched-subunit amino acid transport protein
VAVVTVASTTLWVVVIATSAIAFALKYLGHVVPERWLAQPRAQRINALLPVALLAALVAVETFSAKSALVIDHRVAGLAVALVALILKAPFPVVVVAAAASSALVFHLAS